VGQLILTTPHQRIAGSAVYVNCAVWESVEHFKRAFFNPEFQAARQRVSGEQRILDARPTR
jgi:hypothetical protein